jgi:hypothetical protein
MSDATGDEDPEFDFDGIEHLDFDDPMLERGRPVAVDKRRRAVIPVLPASTVPIEEIRGKPDRRARACVNLRIERTPWPEVVRLLEYSSLEEARADFLKAIASMHREEEAETMRLLTIANAELLLQRSMAMAGADFFVDAEDPEHKIPNRDRLRWHAQAGADLNLLATITGVKAPLRVEVTPTEEQYAALTAAVLAARGVSPVVEAEVLELEEIREIPEEEP